MTRGARLGLLILLPALLLSSACASSRDSIATRGGPDSTGLVLLDCRLLFELRDDDRRLDQYLTTGLDRLRQPQAAQNALYASMDTPHQLVAAQPNRGLLLLGPARPGTYYLEQVGADRDFIEVNRVQMVEYVREPVVCKPGHSSGTNRIAFVVEPGGVTYIGRMNAAADLRSPEEDSRQFVAGLLRVRWVVDDRTWAITWDRRIHNEITAWERVMVSLKKTPWREPIERRLEFLKSQPQ